MKKTDDKFDLPQGTFDPMRVVALEPKFCELTSKGQTHLKTETENSTHLTDVVSLILEGTLEGI